MNLGQLYDRLNQEYQSKKVIDVVNGFGNPHAYRGDYSCLAFEPVHHTTVHRMLIACKEALNSCYEGWKGGSYIMTMETPCYLACKGECGAEITDSVLNLLLYHQPKRSSDDPATGNERDGYVLAMRLLQSDLDLDDVEMSAIARFTTPEVIRRVRRTR